MTPAAGSEPGGEDAHVHDWQCAICGDQHPEQAAAPPSSVAERGGLREVIGRIAGIDPAMVDEDEAARRLIQPGAVEALAAAIHSASGHWTVTQRYSLDQCECRRRATEALAFLDSNPAAAGALRAALATTPVVATLDVERLARAIAQTSIGMRYDGEPYSRPRLREMAAELIAEYASQDDRSEGSE